MLFIGSNYHIIFKYEVLLVLYIKHPPFSIMKDKIKTAYPVYSLTFSNGKILVCGGGGSSRTGIRNGIDEIYVDKKGIKKRKTFKTTGSEFPSSIQSHMMNLVYGLGNKCIVETVHKTPIRELKYPFKYPISLITIDRTGSIMAASENLTFCIWNSAMELEMKRSSDDTEKSVLKDIALSTRYIFLLERSKVIALPRKRNILSDGINIPVTETPACISYLSGIFYTLSHSRKKNKLFLQLWKYSENEFLCIKECMLDGCGTSMTVSKSKIGLSTSDGLIYVLDQDLKIITTKNTGQFAITSLKFLPNQLLASGAADATVYLIKTVKTGDFSYILLPIILLLICGMLGYFFLVSPISLRNLFS
eukprot:GHVP01061406.1.p1 GENE.GHVP01061406.1~~GHVP01061406.1.p1  ORF type:complete len:362 (-),score=27.88 GHVP01061406.1:210-1295(-)